MSAAAFSFATIQGNLTTSIPSTRGIRVENRQAVLRASDLVGGHASAIVVVDILVDLIVDAVADITLADVITVVAGGIAVDVAVDLLQDNVSKVVDNTFQIMVTDVTDVVETKVGMDAGTGTDVDTGIIHLLEDAYTAVFEAEDGITAESMVADLKVDFTDISADAAADQMAAADTGSDQDEGN